ncbi:MAG TPA: hypothetical protein VGQ76_25210 [Thermoanaerobaculia bacterium]|jgi:hypothetical protein|nr:hypothetical protein [Thermoanaerobaculia bacterium]
MDAELKDAFDSIQQAMQLGFAEVRQEFAAVRREMRQEFAEVRLENVGMHAETRRSFDVTAERLRSDIQLVAEVLAQTRKDLTRIAGELDAKIDRTAAETQALIKFSHDSLDRRLRVLETSER